jgi:hypothetical protein
MQAIILSTAAHGSHIYCPALASRVVPTIDDVDDMGSKTLITPQSIAAVPTHTNKAIAAATANSTAGIQVVESAAPMDVDHPVHPQVPLPPTSVNFSKCSHSIMSLESDEPAIIDPTGSGRSAVLNTAPKKQQKGSGVTVSQDSQPEGTHSCNSRNSQGNPNAQSSCALNVTPAVAMVAMQSQINRLTDVFEKSMMTPEDGTSGQRSLALTWLQERDDGLSMNEKVRLISIFQKDADLP